MIEKSSIIPWDVADFLNQISPLLHERNSCALKQKKLKNDSTSDIDQERFHDFFNSLFMFIPDHRNICKNDSKCNSDQESLFMYILRL